MTFRDSPLQSMKHLRYRVVITRPNVRNAWDGCLFVGTMLEMMTADFEDQRNVVVSVYPEDTESDPNSDLEIVRYHGRIHGNEFVRSSEIEGFIDHDEKPVLKETEKTS